MNTQIKFLRKGATIREIDDNNGHRDTTYTDPNAPQFPSINAAKRASRKLQAEHGQGCLKVVSKFKS